eukprot:jgi/Psemu1/30227/gm1.30227_g
MDGRCSFAAMEQRFERDATIARAKDDFASSVVIRKSKKQEDASEKLGLTNTPNGPLSSVMYEPSVKPMEHALIEDDEDEAIDIGVPPHLSVDREVNNMRAVDSPPDWNTPITTPIAQRHISDKLKVKIKFMKIIRNHSIPVVAEKELYERASLNHHKKQCNILIQFTHNVEIIAKLYRNKGLVLTR